MNETKNHFMFLTLLKRKLAKDVNKTFFSAVMASNKDNPYFY